MSVPLNVPVIDLSRADGAGAIERACREWGFFQVRGHDIAPTLSKQMQRVSKEFFAASTQQKNLIRRSAENPWGFYDAELTKNVKDWKEIVDIGPAIGEQQPQWPAEPAEFRSVIEAYSASARAVALEITRMVLTSLGGQAADELSGFERDTSFLRLNYYPACPNPAPSDLDLQTRPDDKVGRLGISHHTDAGALTVLEQMGPESLQVLRNGVWHTVNVMTDALVINIGDVAQVWSNDGYPAPLHRVLANRERERYSAAYFFNPSYEYSYAPLTRDVAPVYKAINWGAFRAGRAAGDYADYGEEVQIAHYRI